jgi:hypothetical protein
VKFFEGCRPEVYIHGAKLRRDKKTGKRMWGLTLIVTLSPELASRCHSMIQRAAEYVATLENGTVDLSLSAVVESCTIDFFSAIDDAIPVVHLQGIDLGGGFG